MTPDQFADSVFSTPVEVFLIVQCSTKECESLLHARGGVSIQRSMFNRSSGSSPRPWRCFRVIAVQDEPAFVFSTPVEVFLHQPATGAVLMRLLHARGGVSDSLEYSGRSYESSPRPWRCFRMLERDARGGTVFSTPVEVFPGR